MNRFSKLMPGTVRFGMNCGIAAPPPLD